MTGRKQRISLAVPAAVLALLALASLACVLVAPDLSGFSMHNSYLLEAGQQADGDQLIVANNATLRPGSAINGDAALVVNHAELEGDINGDAVVVANQLVIGDSARFTGDVSVCAGTVSQSPGATIEGEFKRECSEGGRTTVGGVLDSGFGGWRDNVLFRFGGLIGGALLSGGMAALAAAIFPQRLERMSASIRQRPGMAGGIGCLTVVMAIGVTVVYALSMFLIVPVILLPFAVLGWLVLGLLALVGWLALAPIVGRAITRRLSLEESTPLVVATIGGIALALLVNVWNVFWFTGWIGGLISAVLGSIGLGAVMLTRLGSRRYPQAGQS